MYYNYSQLRLNKAGGLKMNNEQHFSNAQRRYDNMVPEDDGVESVEEMDCPKCGTEVSLWYDKGTCSKCGNKCELGEE